MSFSRRVRRRIRQTRKAQWLQYIGVALLAVGTAIIVAVAVAI